MDGRDGVEVVEVVEPVGRHRRRGGERGKERMGGQLTINESVATRDQNKPEAGGAEPGHIGSEPGHGAKQKAHLRAEQGHGAGAASGQERVREGIGHEDLAVPGGVRDRLPLRMLAPVLLQLPEEMPGHG